MARKRSHDESELHDHTTSSDLTTNTTATTIASNGTTANAMEFEQPKDGSMSAEGWQQVQTQGKKKRVRHLRISKS